MVGHVRELAREHTTLALDAMVEVMTSAKSPPAARVAAATAILDRGYGRPGSASARFTLPSLGSAGDAVQAMAAITMAVASGDLAPTEAAALSRLVEVYIKAIEFAQFDLRLGALESQAGKTRHGDASGSLAPKPSQQEDQ